VHETGTGKTVCACVWLHDGRDNDALVICPKRVVQKWKDALKAWDTRATVWSKEQFKKSPHIHMWSAIVVDEADEFASPLFTKGRSQLSTALYDTVKTNPQIPMLLLTATPIRSNPWNLHSLLTFSGVYIDWKVWRDRFFSLEYRPYLPRPAWLPKPEWRTMIRPTLEKYADIVLMKDCVDSLPPVAEEIIETKTKPLAEGNFFDKHRNEQLNKLNTILEIGKGYRKVLVVAYYVEQVESLAKLLANERMTFMVHGSTKNQEETLKEANECDECYLVCQASLGVGFDADTFSCVVFASMSYKARDWVQMKGRVRRISNLHPVKYYYLIAGPADKAVYKTIMLGKDFLPSEWKDTHETP
jgi:superfamily II DNA or RNA helicase